MTIGRNELFVRPIIEGVVQEPLIFDFADGPITLAEEVKNARLGKLSPRIEKRVKRLEDEKATRRVLVTRERGAPLAVDLPHPDYRYYNKASGTRLYAPPAHALFWKDEGDAVLTFKKTGPWYLRGVGGAPFFGREGLTWQLVAPRINARYLPPGYILDSGAPCAFLRDGVASDELWVVLGWLQTQLATSILKRVINHTRNIQGKDVERLPYPWWASSADKKEAIAITQEAVRSAEAGKSIDREAVARRLEDLFAPDRREAERAA